MQKQKLGHIIKHRFGSRASKVFAPGGTGLQARTKFAVRALTEGLRHGSFKARQHSLPP